MRLQSSVRAFYEARLGQPIQCIRICYEDLLRQTKRTLSKVCELMAVLFENGMDEPYESTDALSSFAAGSLIATTDPKLCDRLMPRMYPPFRS